MKYNNTIGNECWVFILLWFYTLNQMHIKIVLMSVLMECSVTEGKSPFSISGKHEIKWYSANGSTLKLLRRTYLSYSLHLASRSHVLKTLQTYLQSNISFMGNHPCLWKHLRKKHSIKMFTNHNTNGCVIAMVLMAWILMKYIFNFINNIYWLNIAFYTYIFVCCIAEITLIKLVIGMF